MQLFFALLTEIWGPPQWSDLRNVSAEPLCFLAIEAGLEHLRSRSLVHKTVIALLEFVKADESEMLFCGMAVGYEDSNARVNQLKSERRPIDSWVNFI